MAQIAVRPVKTAVVLSAALVKPAVDRHAVVALAVLLSAVRSVKTAVEENPVVQKIAVGLHAVRPVKTAVVHNAVVALAEVHSASWKMKKCPLVRTNALIMSQNCARCRTKFLRL